MCLSLTLLQVRIEVDFSPGGDMNNFQPKGAKSGGGVEGDRSDALN